MSADVLRPYLDFGLAVAGGFLMKIKRGRQEQAYTSWVRFALEEGMTSMLFVTIGKYKATSTAKQRAARRAAWKYPAGMRVIAEYWLQAHDPTLPGLIVVSESDDVAPIMRAIADWDDIIDFTVVPALTAERGLELVKERTELMTETKSPIPPHAMSVHQL